MKCALSGIIIAMIGTVYGLLFIIPESSCTARYENGYERGYVVGVSETTNMFVGGE